LNVIILSSSFNYLLFGQAGIMKSIHLPIWLNLSSRERCGEKKPHFFFIKCYISYTYHF